MTNAARHCQWAAAMGAATPDSALRDCQSYWFRECADACASAALTLFHTGHLPPEEALRCARLCRRCARECQEAPGSVLPILGTGLSTGGRGDRDWDPKGTHRLRDHGGKPFVVNIHRTARHNRTFRTALWTGEHLQVTVMSIDVGEDIGLEMHPDVDQFLRIEQGRGLVRMGKRRDRLDFEKSAR